MSHGISQGLHVAGCGVRQSRNDVATQMKLSFAQTKLSLQTNDVDVGKLADY